MSTLKSVRCIDVATWVATLHEANNSTTLEDVFVLIAMRSQVDMDDVRVTLTPPPGAVTWFTAASSELMMKVRQLDAAFEDGVCTVYFRLYEPDEAVTTPASLTHASTVAEAPVQAAATPDVTSRVNDLFDGPTSSQARVGSRSVLTGSAVRQRAIDESLVAALEHMPESFVPVTMLYVACWINGQLVKAFVDSGAQMSIMNTKTATQCGVMQLLDKRMQGIAKGVGIQRILGRIHIVHVTLNGLFIPFSFSVLENQDIDVIIGLDQLRRHNMVIDLRRNCLTVADTDVPFLPEVELPDYAKPRNDKPLSEEELQKEEEERKKTVAQQEKLRKEEEERKKAAAQEKLQKEEEERKQNLERQEKRRKDEEEGKKQKAPPQEPSTVHLNTLKKLRVPASSGPANGGATPSSPLDNLTASQAAAVAKLLDITGGTISPVGAVSLLKMANWDVMRAVNLCFEG